MKVKCSKCGEVIDVPDAYVGKDIKCPKCQSLLETKKQTSQKEKHFKKSEISIISITGLMVLLVLFFIAFVKEPTNATKSSKTPARNKTQKLSPQKETEDVEIKSLPIRENEQLYQKEDYKRIVNTPIFGIYLGENLDSLRKRKHVVQIKDFWIIKESDPAIETIIVGIRQNRVSAITVLFADTSKANYEAIKKGLKIKYIADKNSYYKEVEVLSEAYYHTRIDDVLIYITLNYDKVIDEKLSLSYTHMPLYEQSGKEIEFQKLKKVIDQL